MFDDTDYIHKGVITKEQIEQRNRELEGYTWTNDPKVQEIREFNKLQDRKEVEGKVSHLLLPDVVFPAYQDVSDNGFKEYGNRDSWKNNIPEQGMSKYADACLRHARKYNQIDGKSGLPHCYHALWNAVAVVWHYEQSQLKERNN